MNSKLDGPLVSAFEYEFTTPGPAELNINQGRGL